ncbi:Cytochrome b-c1 complex subunit 9 [Apodemus speciosus]|uniref:Complex III subunit 9 n=1 Tax=Apodemus speciosus TaxID=105296 RepID=A0ABQ0F9G8_APOSI
MMETSTFALTIAVGALFFERAFDQGADAIYEHINEGGRPRRHFGLKVEAMKSQALADNTGTYHLTVKLWKHIKHKYENKE